MTADTLEKPQQETASPRINRASLDFPETPFENDILRRKPLADQLTGYINTLSKGHTIGVDGDWGSGKTTFGKNWYAQLKEAGHPVAWLDAFAVDYCEDPFLPIANELRKLTKGSSHNAGIVENTKSIGKALIPAFGAATVSGGLKFIIGEGAAEKLGDDLATALGNLAEKQLEEKMRSFDEQRSSVDHLKRALTEFAASKNKPLVFFIDELDRCRPDFAIKLLERIKHFFETENVVFVLLINHEQLAASVQGLYGQNVDGSTYLNKFIHFSISLPTLSLPIDENHQSELLTKTRDILSALTQQLGLPISENENFLYGLAVAKLCLKMSLRDVERAIIHFNLIRKEHQLAASIAAYYGWLIGIKIKDPAVFKNLKKNVENAHISCLETLQIWSQDHVVHMLRALHKTQIKHDNARSATEEEIEWCKQICGRVFSYGATADNLLPTLIRQISPNIPLRG